MIQLAPSFARLGRRNRSDVAEADLLWAAFVDDGDPRTDRDDDAFDGFAIKGHHDVAPHEAGGLKHPIVRNPLGEMMGWTP